MPNPFIVPALSYARRLRHPTLLKWLVGLFVVSVLLPDPLPFLDEMLLGLAALWVSRWKEDKPAPQVLQAKAVG